MHPHIEPKMVELWMRKVLLALEDLSAVNRANDNISASNVATGKILEQGIDDIVTVLDENSAVLRKQMNRLIMVLDRQADIQGAALTIAKEQMRIE
jgi:hypothetical protein